MAVRQPNRAIFEHEPGLSKNTRSVSAVADELTLAPEGDTYMKKIVRLVVVAVLLTCAMSTASLADGGAPYPTCPTCR
jgi:hypothetical protein